MEAGGKMAGAGTPNPKTCCCWGVAGVTPLPPRLRPIAAAGVGAPTPRLGGTHPSPLASNRVRQGDRERERAEAEAAMCESGDQRVANKDGREAGARDVKIEPT